MSVSALVFSKKIRSLSSCPYSIFSPFFQQSQMSVRMRKDKTTTCLRRRLRENCPAYESRLMMDAVHPIVYGKALGLFLLQPRRRDDEQSTTLTKRYRTAPPRVVLYRIVMYCIILYCTVLRWQKGHASPVAFITQGMYRLSFALAVP